MRLIRASDYIYEKTPVIVTPINTTCFNLTCVYNVSFSENSRLVSCSEREVIVRCGDIEMDFQDVVFSHHFLHDFSEFSHVLRLEKERLHAGLTLTSCANAAM